MVLSLQRGVLFFFGKKIPYQTEHKSRASTISDFQTFLFLSLNPPSPPAGAPRSFAHTSGSKRGPHETPRRYISPSLDLGSLYLASSLRCPVFLSLA